MWAGNIEVGCEGMGIRGWRRDGVNRMPIQPESGEVSVFDAAPESKPVHPGFQPAMIVSHSQEDDQERAHRRVPKVVPLQFVRDDRADHSGHEDREPPAREACARSSSSFEQPINASDQPLQGLFSSSLLCGLVSG